MQDFVLPEPTLTQWVKAVLFVPDELFIPVTALNNLLMVPIVESEAALGNFVTEKVDPYRGEEHAQWKAHAADAGGADLLKASYSVAGLEITIVESRNIVTVKASDIKVSFADAENKPEYVNDLIRRVVKTKSVNQSWEFKLPARFDLARPVLLSNQGALPLNSLRTRYDRADVLVWNQGVFFIFYKKPDQLIGFRPADRWFSPDAKSAIRSRLANR